NKKTVEGKIKWEMVVNTPDPQAEYREAEHLADYFYSADLDGSTLYLYELDLSKPKQQSIASAFSALSAIGARYSAFPESDLFLVMRVLDGGVKLGLKGQRLLGDLARSMGAKAGTPERVAHDLLGKIRGL